MERVMNKKVAMSAVVLAGVLMGCTSNKQAVSPQAQSVPSFEVEVLPEWVACERHDYEGNLVKTTCAQARIVKSDELVVLKTNIYGFVPEVGKAYRLDVRQVPVVRGNHDGKQPIWVLNHILSQQ